MKLRPYQSEIINAAVHQFKTSADPVIIDACVGAGKTLMISHITRHVIEKGGRVISLAHTKELVEGACKTFRAYTPDMEVGIFSASIGRKDTKHQITFATEKSLVNSLDLFEKIDLLIIDEAHRVNDRNEKTCYMQIIKHFQTLNPKLRILGLTGTAFRLGTGSIVGKKRLFKKIIASITVPELIEQGYLTRPIAPGGGAGNYDFSKIKPVSGKFRESDLQSAVYDTRLTKSIIADIVCKTENRNKVLVFASTLRHAKEIIDYLPQGTAGYLDGSLPKKEREAALKAFADGWIKFLVNKDILTTGYDEPAIDTIAILRPTESRGLLIQMIGRVLRLHESKADALVLDYAENIEHHGDGSLDELFIKEATASEPGTGLAGEQECPECGNWVSEYARRCGCGYYFTSRDCPECGEENDITRRYCFKCSHELIDPNDKLTLSANKTDAVLAPVLNMSLESYQKNKETLRVVFDTQQLGKVSQFLVPGSRYLKFFLSRMTGYHGAKLESLMNLTPQQLAGQTALFRQPEAIKCKPEGRYWRVVEWN